MAQAVSSAPLTPTRTQLADRSASTAPQDSLLSEPKEAMRLLTVLRSVTLERPLLMRDQDVRNALQTPTRRLKVVRPVSHALKDSLHSMKLEASLAKTVSKFAQLVRPVQRRALDVLSAQITPSRSLLVVRPVTHALRDLRLKETLVVTLLMTVLNNADLARREHLRDQVVLCAHSTHTRSWRDVSHVSHAQKEQTQRLLEQTPLKDVLRSVLLASLVWLVAPTARNVVPTLTRRSPAARSARPAQLVTPQREQPEATPSLTVSRPVLLVTPQLTRV